MKFFLILFKIKAAVLIVKCFVLNKIIIKLLIFTNFIYFLFTKNYINVKGTTIKRNNSSENIKSFKLTSSSNLYLKNLVMLNQNNIVFIEFYRL